jgi:hypothetical protein
LQHYLWDWSCKGPALTVAEARTRFIVYPAGGELDEELIRRFIEISGVKWMNAADCLRANEPCQVLRADLNGDGMPEYVLMGNSAHGRVFSRLNGSWQEMGYVSRPRGSSSARLPVELLERGPIESIAKKWDDLRIGDRTYELYPNFID